MTAEEETKLRNKRAIEFLAGIGADPHLVSFPGQGKLNPRQPVISNSLAPEAMRKGLQASSPIP
jgi:hypothetical protein